MATRNGIRLRDAMVMRQPVSDGLASAVDTREECARWRMDEAAEKGQADNTLNKELISSKPEWG
jgi:hypothetical protein